MYSSLQLAKKWIWYYRNAANGKGHGMHSPFVFQFIEHVLQNKSGYRPPEAIEILRQQLLHDKTVLPIKDLGAGSRVRQTNTKTVGQIARTAVKPKKWGHLFYRLVRQYSPKTIVELGTSLGLSTAYMAAANPHATIITIEGSPAIQQKAQQNFQTLHLENIKSIPAPFDAALPSVLLSLPQVGLAYVDGNHRLQPTLQYFEQLLQKKEDHSIFIFDDIHWSAEMEKAWEQIKKHPEVRYTIDLFFIGVVFFQPAFKVKQHFLIRF